MEDADDKRPTVSDGPRTFDDDQSALIGVDVGGYVIERELGRGGMGVVYAATHPVIGKRAAVKVLNRELSSSPAAVERFLQEARSVNQIGHPNIVDIFAFGVLADGCSYLVMDLLDGEPLRKRVKRGPLPAPDAVALLDEISAALLAAHAKGFIHRDLKPDNVFVVAHPTRFEIKLLDFGLAKLLPTAAIDRAFRTATGAMIGTPDYMSPEQLRGTGVDHRTDIYALGIMAFEVLTRSRPHRFPDGSFDLDGTTFKDALLAVPGVPAALADLIEAMVERDPDARPSLTAVREVLKRVRPSLQSLPALSNVRVVGSELSIEAFSPSQLGATPMLAAPASGTSTVASFPPAPAAAPAPRSKQDSAPPNAAAAGAWQAEPLPATSSAPSHAGLRPSGSHGSTKFGVPPPPVQAKRPHPVAAARTGGESKLWLVLGLALVVAATVALVIVLAS